MHARHVAAVALVVVSLAPARADVEPLRYDLKLDVGITAAAAALTLGLASPWVAPNRCRVCAPGAVDAEVREVLRWRDPRPARHASDLLAHGILPAAALANSLVSSWRRGEPSAAWVDTLVIAEATALGADLTGLTKDVVARRRPAGGNRSFFSGHTSMAYSLAAAAGTVSTMRGYPSAPWVWAGGMALATGVGYLRVAGDAHWMTDVVAGAAVGSLVGFAVPWFLHRRHLAPRRSPPTANPG